MAGAKEHFEAARVARDGYLKPSKQLIVDVYTTKPTNAGALTLANALFLALEDRGHQVTLAPRDQPLWRPVLHIGDTHRRDPYWQDSWRPGRPTVVFVGTVAIGLTIYETTEKVEVHWVDGKFVRVTRTGHPRGARSTSLPALNHKREVPTGLLAVRGYSPYGGTEWEQLWIEAKPGELRKQLDGVVDAIERVAPTIAELADEAKRRAELQRQEQEVEHQRWVRVEAERRRVQMTEDSRAQLLALVEHWALANRIEGFLEDVAGSLDGVPPEERAGLHERLERARALLGGSDALAWFRSWRLPEER